MDATQYYGSTFLKLADVRAANDGKIRAVITNIEEGRYGKLDVTFDDGTKLSCNSTNTRTLARAFGKNTDSWVGQVVNLTVGEIEYQGQRREAIIAVPVSPPPNKKQKPARQADFDDFGDDEIKF